MNLVYKTETPLFVILLIFSILFVWLPVVGMLVAMAGFIAVKGDYSGLVILVYVAAFLLFYLFAQSAFISHIRGGGVRITKDQFPDLHRQLEDASRKLGMEKVPEAYLLNSNGVLNAIATRFLWRNFLILYADVVNGLEDRPGAVSFYIGHELGHIARGHLTWGPILAPGKCLPLAGYAYRRAQEYTCDLHGLACCSEHEDAQRALVMLAAGKRRWKSLDLAAYSQQLGMTGGFWMSFHELIGDYPWLVKRVEHVAAVAQNRPYKTPRRSFFAWLLALFVPRFGSGSSPVSGLVAVAIVGILAAIAIPAYQDYIARSQTAEAIQLAGSLERPLAEYYVKNIGWPSSLGSSMPSSNVGRYTDSIQLVGASGLTIGVLATMKAGGVNLQIAGKTLEIWTMDGGNTWHCGPGDMDPMDAKFLPTSCREQGAP